MEQNEIINEIISVLETMKQERLKRSCSRDSLSQANAFGIAIAVIRKVIKENEQTNES